MSIHKIIGEAMARHVKFENDIFEKCLRENATPPIKGEITTGKIRNRGIRRVWYPLENVCWLEQRGRQISPRVKFTVEV